MAGAGINVSKSPTAEQKRHFAKIVEHGCIICRSPAVVHHCFTGAGGRKNHDLVIPLCPMHHTNGGEGIAIHPFRKAFEANFGTEQELLDKTQDRENKEWLISVCKAGTNPVRVYYEID